MILRNQQGQMTIEMVLILTMLFGIVVGVSNTMREKQILASVVEGPWAAVQGMIEDGVWQPAGISKAGHPSVRSRHRSYEADAVPEGG